MDVTRQDAWTKDEDIILAETVIRYIREGKTQLEAFREVAKQLSRTSSACGFRWNATLRRSYQKAIEQAKEERKQKNRKLESNGTDRQGYEKDTIETAITLLEKMKKNYSVEFHLTRQEQDDMITHLKQENERLKAKIERYEAAWTEMAKLWEWVTSEPQS